MAGKLEIVTMHRAQLDLAVEWARREGWNPGLHDAEAFFAADPRGFHLELLDGEPVGCISSVRYGPGFGFLGFYIVAPVHRGKGYGRRLWDAALARMAGRNVGLDGVVEQQANYRKSGFRLAHGNVRYEWLDRPQPPPRPPSLVAAAEVARAELERLDRRCFPAPRRRFLTAWLGLAQARALACRCNGVLRGYGMIRRCTTGWKIGPLFADDYTAAEMLLLELSRGAAPDEPVYLDVPEVNPEAMRLACAHRMREVFGTARMYNREFPALASKRIFGITSFELG